MQAMGTYKNELCSLLDTVDVAWLGGLNCGGKETRGKTGTR
jgi:hypothetical protein